VNENSGSKNHREKLAYSKQQKWGGYSRVMDLPSPRGVDPTRSALERIEKEINETSNAPFHRDYPLSERGQGT